MREVREKGQMMKIVCLKNTKKDAVASGKSAFYTLKIQKYYVFQLKTGLIVKHPFSFF